MMQYKRWIAVASILLWPFFSYAALHLELTQGLSSALPIAVVNFSGQIDDKAQTNIAEVVQQDLRNSGRFHLFAPGKMFQFPHTAKEVEPSYWKSTKVNYVVVGSTKKLVDGNYEVTFFLVDLYPKSQASNPVALGILVTQKLTTTATGMRALAHRIADIIYQKIVAQPGLFSTKIAYVLVKNAHSYTLEIADYDGNNSQVILQSLQPITSPTWSPDGKAIAYVSFEQGNPIIYLQILATGARKIISAEKGLNSAPAFSPDGKRLAVVLTLSGMPNIYVKSLLANKPQQITKNNAIDTEPVWSLDGKSIFFTSDRGGSPQIYQVNLDTNYVKRVSYQGKYNARASFTADGKNMIVLHRAETGNYAVAIQNLATGRIQVLADAPYTQSPSIAPNGAMVLYSWRNKAGVFLLSMVSTDGKVQLNLPSRDGSVREPAWSPFLSGQ